MSDSCGFDAGDRQVRALCKRAAESGCGDVRRARACVRSGLFAIATLIFAAAFSGGAAAQGPRPGPGPGPGGGDTLVPVATSNAHRSSQATLFDVGSQFLQRFNAVYSFRTAASAANNPQGGGAE